MADWVIWTYALRPGWERAGPAESREAAREIRQELIDEGYPPEFVSIRPEAALAPKRRPPLAVIKRVHQALETAGGSAS